MINHLIIDSEAVKNLSQKLSKYPKTNKRVLIILALGAGFGNDPSKLAFPTIKNAIKQMNLIGIKVDFFVGFDKNYSNYHSLLMELTNVKNSQVKNVTEYSDINSSITKHCVYIYKSIGKGKYQQYINMTNKIIKAVKANIYILPEYSILIDAESRFIPGIDVFYNELLEANKKETTVVTARNRFSVYRKVGKYEYPVIGVLANEIYAGNMTYWLAPYLKNSIYPVGSGIGMLSNLALAMIQNTCNKREYKTFSEDGATGVIAAKLKINSIYVKTIVLNKTRDIRENPDMVVSQIKRYKAVTVSLSNYYNIDIFNNKWVIMLGNLVNNVGYVLLFIDFIRLGQFSFSKLRIALVRNKYIVKALKQ